MYLIAITASLCASYFILRFVFPALFGVSRKTITKQSLMSLAIIIALSVGGYVITYLIKDPVLSNRFLHGFCGGFVAMAVSYLAVKDSSLKLTMFQFFVISALTVTALGVANEILELILQTYTGLIFNPSLNDTWLDLVSNTVGILVGGIVFVPF